eukprot:1486309-Alexandrium_andersonii.AAC.1
MDMPPGLGVASRAIRAGIPDRVMARARPRTAHLGPCSAPYTSPVRFILPSHPASPSFSGDCVVVPCLAFRGGFAGSPRRCGTIRGAQRALFSACLEAGGWRR